MLLACIITTTMGSYHHAYKGSASDLGFDFNFNFNLASDFDRGFIIVIIKYLVLKQTYLGVQLAIVAAVIKVTI